MLFWKVDIIESERGYGQKIDHVVYFYGNEKRKARRCVDKYNKQNTSETVPDWYMRADGPFPIEIDDAIIKMLFSKTKQKKTVSGVSRSKG